MVCQGCGASYDSTFKFCPYCGRAKPEPEVIHLKVEDVQYEVCEIEVCIEPGFYNFLQSLFGAVQRGYFEAIAVGPRGRYSAGLISGVMYDANHPDFLRQLNEKCLDQLVGRLTSEGWEPVSRGEHWYSYRFRRMVQK
jgi:hypothetical protein